ncbi:MAG TPA: type II toxin-antitoxin system PemK/MazF family toxin [Pirellulaceae bacterium]|nr:type II toxin-antitoxin system PemK/MazF family toxin [Pirellulaceae bacterium]
MTRSEVWWADLPPPLGRRPVLILTRSTAVAARNQVVVAQVTTTVHGLPCEVSLTRADGLPRDCVVNCDVLLTVPKARQTSRIARLSRPKMDAVHQALKFALDIP